MDASAMHRLVGATATTIRQAWVRVVLHLREENPVSQLSPYAIDLRGLSEAADSLAAAERQAFIAAGAATARGIVIPDRIAKKVTYFDDVDPEVMTWAERNRLDLIRNLTFEQRAMVRYALSVARETGENPRVTAQRILDDIGLTEQQAAAVEGYRALIERGQLGEALQRQLSSAVSDRTIRAAREADRSLTPQQIDAAVARYRANALRLRAETIARTEAQRIAHQASTAAYGQAVRRGDLEADQMEQEWVATRDPRTRDSHAAMNGQKRLWGEPFLSGAGVELRYPGDELAVASETVNCRCTRVVHLRPPQAMRRAA